MERTILVCDCYSPEHQILIEYDKEEDTLSLQLHLVNYQGFFKRLLVGIKYTFGYKCKYGNFDMVELGPEEQQKLLAVLNEANKNKEKNETRFIF